MSNILYIFQLVISLALIGLVLLQPSAVGADAGLGGGANPAVVKNNDNRFMTRLTSLVALLFFLSSLSLGYSFTHRSTSTSLIDQVSSDKINVNPPAQKADKTKLNR